MDYHFGLTDWNLEAILRLVMASVMGAMLGLDREMHGRSAGLRTHLLVSVGAALAMVVSVNFGRVFGPSVMPHVQVDPARVAYGVMAGVGFLGAGTIMHQGLGIRGLTTAATLWCAAALGLANGFGMFAIALGGTVIMLAALRSLEYLERKISNKEPHRIILRVRGVETGLVDRYRICLAHAGAYVTDWGYVQDFAEGQTEVTLSLLVHPGKIIAALDAVRSQQADLLQLTLE
jgi:putative Mg2+ transporter-C (MgtC) family protein